MAEGGTATGVYSHSRTALTPQTRYWFLGYATNASGTAISAENNFYTLSNPPNIQAANFIASASSSSQIDLAWDAADFPATGATVKGYVLLVNTGAGAPTFISSNGTAPAAGTGSIVSSTITDITVSYNHTGRAGSTQYTYLLVPFSWDGTNAATYNYLTAGALTATATTTAAACTVPATQASAVTFGTTTSNSIVVNWTAGSGDRSLVIVRQGAAVNTMPTTGTAYTTTGAYGDAGPNNLGSLNYVSYAGAANTFTLTNLTASTLYYISVFSYNDAGKCYNTTVPPTGNRTTNAAASSIETFEPAAKAVYTNGPLTSPGVLGSWQFDDALIGTTAGSDRFVGTRSARIQKTGAITTLFTKTGGLGTVTVQHALYGTDASTTWQMYVSDNNGASYVAYTSAIITTSSTTLTAQAFTVNVPGNLIRVRFKKLTGGPGSRLNFDQISLGDYVSPNTLTTGSVTGSPYCLSNTAGSVITVPFTSTGTFTSGNVYTAQLSDAAGSFSNPTDIGNLTSVANAGNIAAVIPAATVSGTGYRIRVVSSNPVLIAGNTSAPLIVVLNAPDASNFNALITGSSTVTLGWNLPVSCYDQIMIVGKAITAITAIPTSPDGSAYTANSIFGSGTTGIAGVGAGEYVMYENAGGTSVSVSGLTNGTLYYFEIFVRKGTDWSPGVVVSVTPSSTLAGDFQTRATGNWNLASTWSVWNGTAWIDAGTGGYDIYPGASKAAGDAGTASAVVKGGHTVLVTTSVSADAIKNLTVESTGVLYTNNATENGNRYLTVYGDIRCDGRIGSTSAALLDNISFNTDGAQQSINGTGIFNPSRIRKNYNTNISTNVLIGMNTNIQFNSGTSNASGTCIYNNYSGLSDFNITVNAGTTLQVNTLSGTSGNVSIDGIDGEGVDERGGTITVNGTLSIGGTLFMFTNNITNPVEFIIGETGVVNCANVCTGNTATSLNGSAAAGAALRILPGGLLNMTGGLASYTETYNKPFSKRTNTLAPYTYIEGLGTVNQTYDLQPGSIVRYSSTGGNIAVQTDLIYSNLEITGGATSTVSNTLNVNKDLTIAGTGTLNPSANVINLGGNWINYNSTGFIEGTSTVNFNGTAAQTITCPGGEIFYNATIANASTAGVELNDDVTVSNNMNSGASGRLFFGQSPHTLTQSKMTGAANNLLGSGTALIDMSGAAGHILRIGCQFPGFTGSFVAGTGLVNYYADIAAGAPTGDQTIMPNPVYYGLSLGGSGNKIAPVTTLEVKGNLTGEGTAIYLHNGGTALLSGATAQDYIATVPFDFYNLTNNNPVNININSDLSVARELFLMSASQSFLNTGNVTLKSTGALTANVAPIVSGTNIVYGSGRFFVERYISYLRKWQFISVPTDSTQTIKNAWQEGAGAIGTDPVPGYGMQVTQFTGGTGIGFDAFSPGGPSLKLHNSATNDYTGILNTTDPIKTTAGYMAFARGDRLSLGSPATTTNPTTLRTKGMLYTGNQPAITVPAAKFKSIGNPYASPLDLATLSMAGLVGTLPTKGTVYIWDPSLTGGYGLGAFQTLVYSAGNYNIIPGGGTIYNAAILWNRIESGQAFFVNGATGGGSVTFTETAKTNGSTLVSFTGSGEPDMSKTLSSNLYVSAGNNPVLVDGSRVYFNDAFAAGADDMDAPKMSNTGENFGLRSAGRTLVADYRNLPGEGDTVHLNLANTKVQNYLLEIDAANLQANGRSAFLEDKYLQSITPLNLNGKIAVGFNIVNIPGSYAQDRFRIIFKQAIPVMVTGITAERIPDGTVQVKWNTLNEKNLIHYETERSIDGVNFGTIGTKNPANNAGGNVSYDYTDLNPLSAKTYYRVKGIGNNGEYYYTGIAEVEAITAEPAITVTPNPVKDRMIRLQMKNMEEGSYDISIVSNSGQLVYKGVVSVHSYLQTQTISLPGDTAPGKYQIIFIGKAGKRNTVSILVMP